MKYIKEGVDQGAKSIKLQNVKLVVIPVVEPIKVDVHQIFNKFKQLHDNYENKIVF